MRAWLRRWWWAVALAAAGGLVFVSWEYGLAALLGVGGARLAIPDRERADAARRKLGGLEAKAERRREEIRKAREERADHATDVLNDPDRAGVLDELGRPGGRA